MTGTELTQRTVAVWRRVQLPMSETFILNQVAALQRWRGQLVGVHAIDPSLTVPGVRLLDPNGTWNRLQRGGASRAGWTPGLRALLDGIGADIVHAHFLTDASTIWSSVAAARRPLVVTAHGYDVTEAAPHMRREHPAAWRAFVRSVALFLPVSHFLAERLVGLGVPPSRIQVHYTGIPVPPDPMTSGRAGIAFVGRLVEKKGCADLLEAMSRLPQPLRSTPITVVGDGPLRASLEQQAADLGLHVRFRGALPYSAVAAELARAQVFCVPSRTARGGDAEGFGMVFAEASALRLPVVTYSSGGTPEAVADGRSGLLCPEGDVAALSAALQRVLADAELRSRLGAFGRERVERSFDVVRQSVALEDVYDRLATTSRRSSARG
ncbi:MAG TPA: glycosyltransferase [Propionibacteriaceae bacterium]|jgi:glycosyltransferase involved in cell wall biosynthesis